MARKGSPENQDQSDSDAQEMTAADAAELVVREVAVLDDKKQPTGKIKQVAVKADEVLSFREYGDYVVVVTIDGQKLTGSKAAK